MPQQRIRRPPLFVGNLFSSGDQGMNRGAQHIMQALDRGQHRLDVMKGAADPYISPQDQSLMDQRGASTRLSNTRADTLERDNSWVSRAGGGLVDLGKSVVDGIRDVAKAGMKAPTGGIGQVTQSAQLAGRAGEIPSLAGDYLDDLGTGRLIDQGKGIGAFGRSGSAGFSNVATDDAIVGLVGQLKTMRGTEGKLTPQGKALAKEWLRRFRLSSGQLIELQNALGAWGFDFVRETGGQAQAVDPNWLDAAGR